MIANPPGSTNGRTARMGSLALIMATMTATQAVAADDRPVTVETVRSQPIVEKIELSGSVTSRRVAQLSPELPGSVAVVHHDSGAHVTSGETLIELDPKLEQINREQAIAQIAEAKAQLADAQRRLKIAEGLATRAYGPQNDVDTIKTEIMARNATLQRLEAQRSATEERLLRHVVKAPFAGVISRKLTEVGQWVVPGTAIVELIELERLRIELPVPQRYFPQINDRIDVKLSFSAMPDNDFPAKVDAIIPVSDPNARTFMLRVVPVNEKLAITPGMSSRATLALNTGREGLVVSRDALLRQPDGRITVWVVEAGDDGKDVVRERRVAIGLSFDGVTEIRSGLKAGDRVVVRGNEALIEGQSVKTAS